MCVQPLVLSAEHNRIAQFVQGHLQVVQDFIGGQAQHQVTADCQLIVTLPILAESDPGGVVGIAVDFHHQPPLPPQEVDAGVSAAAGHHRLVEGEQRREAFIQRARRSHALLRLAVPLWMAFHRAGP